MSGGPKQPISLRASFFNLPNQLTFLRLVLSLVLFCFLANGFYLLSLVLFLIASATDWLDGYFARKYEQITSLGRVLDPFADKVVVCGTFIFLASDPRMLNVSWGLRSWMVVVIVARELLVTALRSFIEERGGDFSAKWSGKIKMGLQCFAACACLFYLTFDNPLSNAPAWCWILLVASVWAATISTLYSGVEYVRAAMNILFDYSA
ncbi:MAG: CDP-diacylglycerol--glycerol-3-phosphate 3-phosphatidyltransferase [Thermoguttaceae bacterium]